MLSSFELEASCLDSVCDDDLFLVVSDDLASCKGLASYLNVEVCQTQESNCENPNLIILKEWKSKNGSGATINALVCAFLKSKENKIAIAIIEYVHQISESCQKSSPDSVHPEKAIHRYRNWDKMSQEERKKTKEKLVIENECVRRKFTTCFRRISKSFEKRKVDVVDLKTTLGLLMKSKSSEVALASNIPEVFFIISQHSTFYNYQLLENIVEELGNAEEQKLFSDYKNDILKPYLQRSIFEVPSDSTISHASKDSSITACLRLVEKIDLSAHDVMIIKHDLAKLLQLPSLELVHYDDGSIHLVFAISKAFFNDCPATSPLRQYIVWEKSSSSYIITEDIILILFTRRCAEVDIINKILKSKQDTIVSLNNQLALEMNDKETARGYDEFDDVLHVPLSVREKPLQLEKYQEENKEELMSSAVTLEQQLSIMNEKYQELLQDIMSPSEDESPTIRMLRNNNKQLMERLDANDKGKEKFTLTLSYQASKIKKLSDALQMEREMSQKKSLELEQATKERGAYEEREGKEISLNRKIQQLEDQLHDVTVERNEIAKIYKDFATNEEETATIKRKLFMEVDDLRSQLSKQKTEFENFISKLTKDSEDEKNEMQKDIDRLAALQQEAFMKLSHVNESRIPSIFGSLNGPHNSILPVKAVMTKFSEYKKSDNYLWYSPPFYTAEKGYKMCLVIWANGDYMYSPRNHVSAHVHLMAGENDDDLFWPIAGEVTLTVASSKGPKLKHKIHFNRRAEPGACDRVLKGGTPTPYGFASSIGIVVSQFVPHSDLSPRDSPYLIDDLLPVQVDFVPMVPEALSPPCSPSLERYTPSVELLISDIIMPHFMKYKKSGAEYKSKEFYSHPEGYKFVLLIYANGRSRYQGKSISVFIHLLKGENDSKLRFPFRGELLIQVLNEKGDHFNVEKSVKFDEIHDPDGKYGGRVQFFSRAMHGYGFDNFVQHSVLPFRESTNTKYLRDDDSIHFRVICKSVTSLGAKRSPLGFETTV